MKGIRSSSAFLMMTLAFAAASVAGVSARQRPDVDVTGLWQALDVPYAPWMFQFTQNGSRVTGTMQQNGGLVGLVNAEEGTIEGARISFKGLSPDGARRITFTGTVNGSEIVLNRSTQTITSASQGGTGLFGASAVPQFTIRRAPEGTTMAAVAPGRGGAPIAPAGAIPAPRGALRGQTPSIPGAITVTGSVAIDGEFPRPLFRFLLTDTNGRGFSPDTLSFAAGLTQGPGAFAPAVQQSNPPRVNEATLTASPSFTMQLPPGDYHPTISGLADGYRVKSITSGTANLLTETLKVTAAGALPITITIAAPQQPPRFRVSGRVVNWDTRSTIGVQGNVARAVPISPVQAVLLTNSTLSQPYRASVDAGGRFEFTQVLPGTYELWGSPATRTAPAGVVIVSDRDVVSLDVTAPPVGPCGGC